VARLERSLAAPIALDWDISQPAPTVTLRRALGYAVWFQDLGRPELDAVQRRLGFPTTLLRILRASRDLKADLPRFEGSSPSVWTSRLDGVPRLAIYAVAQGIKGSSTSEAAESALEEYALRWRHMHPATNGDSLRSLGLPPGPRYQTILDRLRAAWLDGKVTTAEQEAALLAELVVAESPDRARRG
jgi:tRNA nucleotidyltransferase (CCA-adding enzyme)